MEKLKTTPTTVAIFIGHQGVSGVNYWHNQNKNAGSVEHLKLIESRSGDDRALIKTLNAWKDNEGKTIGADTRTITFGGRSCPLH